MLPHPGVASHLHLPVVMTTTTTIITTMRDNSNHSLENSILYKTLDTYIRRADDPFNLHCKKHTNFTSKIPTAAPQQRSSKINIYSYSEKANTVTVIHGTLHSSCTYTLYCRSHHATIEKCIFHTLAAFLASRHCFSKVAVLPTPGRSSWPHTIAFPK